jgi:hypothetical protein
MVPKHKIHSPQYLGFLLLPTYSHQNQSNSEELMKLQSLQSLSLPALAAAALLCSPASFGATINNIVYTNTSDPNASVNTAAVRNEFRSAGSVGAAITNGNSVSVTATTQWVAGYQVTTAGPANFLNIYPSFELSFTVDDPTNIGYSLDATSLTRGYLAASFASGGTFSLGIQASGTNLFASIDSGSGLALNGPLTFFGDTVAANDTTTSATKLVTGTRNASIGNFVGTRNFNIVISPRPSPAGSIIFQNDFAGEAAIRFGLGTTVPGMLLSTYPGAEAEDAATHGNFLTVTANFNQSSTAVPEPTTTALLGFGLIAIVAVAKRRA